MERLFSKARQPFTVATPLVAFSKWFLPTWCALALLSTYGTVSIVDQYDFGISPVAALWGLLFLQAVSTFSYRIRQVLKAVRGGEAFWLTAPTTAPRFIGRLVRGNLSLLLLVAISNVGGVLGLRVVLGWEGLSWIGAAVLALEVIAVITLGAASGTALTMCFNQESEGLAAVVDLFFLIICPLAILGAVLIAMDSPQAVEFVVRFFHITGVSGLLPGSFLIGNEATLQTVGLGSRVPWSLLSWGIFGVGSWTVFRTITERELFATGYWFRVAPYLHPLRGRLFQGFSIYVGANLLARQEGRGFFLGLPNIFAAEGMVVLLTTTLGVMVFFLGAIAVAVVLISVLLRGNEAGFWPALQEATDPHRVYRYLHRFFPSMLERRRVRPYFDLPEARRSVGERLGASNEVSNIHGNLFVGLAFGFSGVALALTMRLWEIAALSLVGMVASFVVIIRQQQQKASDDLLTFEEWIEAFPDGFFQEWSAPEEEASEGSTGTMKSFFEQAVANQKRANTRQEHQHASMGPFWEIFPGPLLVSAAQTYKISVIIAGTVVGGLSFMGLFTDDNSVFLNFLICIIGLASSGLFPLIFLANFGFRSQNGPAAWYRRHRTTLVATGVFLGVAGLVGVQPVIAANLSKELTQEGIAWLQMFGEPVFGAVIVNETVVTVLWHTVMSFLALNLAAFAVMAVGLHVNVLWKLRLIPRHEYDAPPQLNPVQPGTNNLQAGVRTEVQPQSTR